MEEMNKNITLSHHDFFSTNLLILKLYQYFELFPLLNLYTFWFNKISSCGNFIVLRQVYNCSPKSQRRSFQIYWNLKFIHNNNDAEIKPRFLYIWSDINKVFPSNNHKISNVSSFCQIQIFPLALPNNQCLKYQNISGWHFHQKRNLLNFITMIFHSDVLQNLIF